MNIRFQGLIGIKNKNKEIVQSEAENQAGWVSDKGARRVEGGDLSYQGRTGKRSFLGKWFAQKKKKKKTGEGICGNHDKVRGITGVEQRNQAPKLTTGVCERGEKKKLHN